MDSNNQKVIILGTGHKVSARVGWSDLGWAMENIYVKICQTNIYSKK